ncbi:Phage portal protein, SPP1 Gp6 [Desulfosporosinus acidiphilus SJ4]|uniref:Phage portal protein, SPP1 Gp6 n=1 Tax=Desulfosporosinus acidiphilus (strain DSM 22704 / JCM 16185 / SJ4) TaxID=646529 RepID=I4D5C6_DESAJ|nr:phage portal protein [Desulfosporosinus acidiphilus]AFM41000.1 Phage portal protein, SPP1 Gp6 [Desulfosporosinus acidiphilus SJ4]
MNLQEYINAYYDGDEYWFIQFTNYSNSHVNVSQQNNVPYVYSNQERIMNIINIKDYLSGKHAILDKSVEMWNGKEFHPRTIVLNYAKTILNFSTSYLLKNPVTISGDEASVPIVKDVYKKGNYNKIDWDILDKVCKYGSVAEYVYIDKDKEIRSKLILPEDSYPVYNDENEYIGFVEYFTSIMNVSYWNVFTEDKVLKYDDFGGEIRLVGEFNNPSGLPIIYKNKNELDETAGRSDLEDYVNIVDALEDLISKYTDSIYKFINPIPVVVGQKLGIGKSGEGAIPSTLVGTGLQLDDGGQFSFANGQLDYQSFESVWKILYNSLLQVSSVPAVSMGVQDVSNLSEVSIKLLFSLADLRAGMNEMYMREGIEQRFKAFETLLKAKGIVIDANALDVVFEYARPMNQTDIINDLKTLRDMGAISLQSTLEQCPMTYDVAMELERIKKEDKAKVKKQQAQQQTFDNNGNVVSGSDATNNNINTDNGNVNG